MKKLILSLCCLFGTLLVSCSNDSDKNKEYNHTPALPERICGADIGWYTEMAADGNKFYNAKGQEMSCPQLMKDLNLNALRFRVWVNPQKKNCNYGDLKDLLVKCEEAYRIGLPVMIDFHFSDWWADPSRQEMPDDWVGLSLTDLQAKVREHVSEVLHAVSSQTHASVRWIQIGNETRSGMMYPAGQLWTETGDIPNGWKNFVSLYQAGYESAKSVCPNAMVMPHLNCGYQDNMWWFEKFTQAGGKYDMIALSHYPMADDPNQSWRTLNNLAILRAKQLNDRWKVPVVFAEFGVKPANFTEAALAANDFYTKVSKLDNTVCAGVFYWEPEVYDNWKPASYDGYGWGAYDQGAFNQEGKATSILTDMPRLLNPASGK